MSDNWYRDPPPPLLYHDWASNIWDAITGELLNPILGPDEDMDRSIKRMFDNILTDRPQTEPITTSEDASTNLWAAMQLLFAKIETQRQYGATWARMGSKAVTNPPGCNSWEV